MKKGVSFFALGGAIDPEGIREPIGDSSYALVHWSTSSVLLVDAGGSHLSPEEEEEQSAFLQLVEERGTANKISTGVVGSIVGAPLQYDDLADISALPNLQFLDQFDHIYVVMSHSHHDHMGACPFLLRQYCHKIRGLYTAIGTLDVSDWLWGDYISRAVNEGRTPLFDMAHFLQVRQYAERSGYVHHGSVVQAGPFQLTFTRAGHILDALSVHVETKDPACSIFFTGDISFHKQETVGAAILPEKKVDIVVSEATYAGSVSEDRQVLKERAALSILSTLENGGRVVAPVLSNGRAQVLYAICKEYGIVDRFPFYIDGLVCQMSAVYAKYGAIDPAIAKHFVDGRSRRRRHIQSLKEPYTVLASSGMVNGRRAMGYVAEVASDPKALIELSCYQNPCSGGSRLLNTPRGSFIEFDDRRIQLNARVQLDSLSAHADARDIHFLLETLKPEVAFLVHGSEVGMDRFIPGAPVRTLKTYINKEYQL